MLILISYDIKKKTYTPSVTEKHLSSIRARQDSLTKSLLHLHAQTRIADAGLLFVFLSILQVFN